MSVGSVEVTRQLFQVEEGGAVPTSTHQLILRTVPTDQALNCYGRWHYLGRIKTIATLHYGVFFENRLVGCISMGSPNATEIKGFYDRNNQEGVWEIKRLALSPICPKNSESRVIAIAIRLVKKLGAWLIVTYADDGIGHTGVIYKAAGFDYQGLTAQKNDFWVNGKIQQRGKTKGVDGVWKPRSRKHLFIKQYNKEN